MRWGQVFLTSLKSFSSGSDLVEIQYFRTTITEEHREEFGRLTILCAFA